MYEIEFTPESLDDISGFRKFEQQTIFAEIKTQLSYEPTIETRNRKRLNNWGQSKINCTTNKRR